MQDWVEPLVGAVVLAITLLDVFLTVLYARAGAGLIAPWLARGVWRVFRALSGGKHAGILSFCGPAQLVVLVLVWGALLALGAGLMIHPGLGTGVRSSSGTTDTDFVTALFVGGSSMSIVGASDYAPTTAGYKLLFLFGSLVGLSVTSLTLTYLMQVYTALRSRNTLGLTVHAQSGDTGDAAELLARWGPRGRFDGPTPTCRRWPASSRRSRRRTTSIPCSSTFASRTISTRCRGFSWSLSTRPHSCARRWIRASWAGCRNPRPWTSSSGPAPCCCAL